MEIINNNYRIIKREFTNRFFDQCIVQNMSEEKNERMYILNSDTFPQEMLKFFIKEYYNYAGISTVHVMNVSYFDMIFSADMRAVEKKTYFFVTEVEDTTNVLIREITTQEDPQILMGYMMDILRIFDYTSRRDLRYPYLDGDSFYLTERGEVKLKSTLLIHLEQLLEEKSDKYHILYLSPETFRGSVPSIKSEIYSLGVYLENFFRNKTFSLKYRKSLYGIVQKMKSYHEDQRYDHFHEIMAEINLSLGTDYERVFSDHSIYLQKNFCFMYEGEFIGGREAEKQVIEKTNAFKNNEYGVYTYQILGEYGTGKTAFAAYLSQILSMRGVNIFTDYYKEESIQKRSIWYILIQIIEEKGSHHIIKYPKVEEFLKDEMEIEDELSTIAQIGAFISEEVANEPTAIIIDDFQISDSITFGVLKYLNTTSFRKNKLLIIYTLEDPLVSDYIRYLPLQNLTVEETGFFLKKLISSIYIPAEFAQKVHEETQGNRHHIIDTINTMYEQKYLRLLDDGFWFIDVDSYDEVVFPDEKESDITGIFQDIDSLEQQLLIYMVCLKNSFTLCQYGTFRDASLSEEQLEKSLKELIYIGILTLTLKDSGYCYEFKDKLLKKKIYDSLDDKTKQAKHTFVRDRILEKLPERKQDELLLDELVYQLRKTENYLLASSYANRLSKMLFQNGKKDQSILMSKEALDAAIMSRQKRRMMMAYLKYAKILAREYRLEEAIAFYMKCIQIAQELGQYKIQINCFRQLCSTHILLNDFEKAYMDIESMKNILKGNNYSYGEILCLNAQSEYLVYSDQFEPLKEVLDHLEELLENESEEVKGEYYNTKAIYFSYLGKYERVKENYEKAIAILENNENYEWLCKTYNNFGIFYSEYIKDNDNAIIYYNKMIDIAEEHGILSSRSVGYLNLGECMFFSRQIEKAYEYFNISLEEASRIKRQNLIFYNNILLADIKLCQLDIFSAKEYLSKAEKELEQFPFQGRVIYSYYKVKARFHLYSGDSQKALSYIELASEGPSGLEESEVKILKGYIYLMMTREREQITVEINEIITEIKKMIVYPIFIQKAIFLLCFVKGTAFEVLASSLLHWIKEEGYLEATVPNSPYIKNIDSRLFSKEIKEQEHDQKTLAFEIQMNLLDSYLSIFYYQEKEQYFEMFQAVAGTFILMRDLVVASKMELRQDNVMGVMMGRIINMMKRIGRLETVTDLKSLMNFLKDEDQSGIKSFYQRRFRDNKLLHTMAGNTVVQSIIDKKMGIEAGEISANNLVADLKYSNLKNIEQLAEFIRKVTWATGLGVISYENKEFHNILWLGEQTNEKEMDIILNQSMAAQDVLVSSRYWSVKELVENKKDFCQRKSYFCIPISGNRKHHRDRRNNDKISGYIYLESRFAIDRFTGESYEKIKNWVNLIGIFMENYNLSMKYMLDKMTGAYNRQYFDSYIKMELEECQQVKEQTFSMVIMDIDNFKLVNDTYGHSEGDVILKKFTEIVQHNIRSYDMFARYGGEEFALILKEMNSTEAYRISERIRLALERELNDPAGKPVTASLGVSTFREHGVWEEELIRRADMAMYRAKSEGKNKVVVWSEEIGDGRQATAESFSVRRVFAENEELEKLMITGLNLTKYGGASYKITRFLEEIVSYFRGQVLYQIHWEDQNIRSIWRYQQGELINLGKDLDKEINLNIVRKVAEGKEGIFTIDWEDITKTDELTGLPEWYSVMCAPVISIGQVSSLLYMKSPFRKKEFTHQDSEGFQLLSTIIGKLLEIGYTIE